MYIMFRFILFLGLSLLPITFSFSQKNLQNGYVVTLENDTLLGYIDYRNARYNSKKCVFHSEKDIQPIVYLPEDIQSYRLFNNKYYVSKKIKKESGEEWVFLEYLVNGITNLYYLRSIDGAHYFIEKGSEIFELTNKVSIVSDGSNNYYRETKLYIGQLALVYSDAKQLQYAIKTAKFNRKTFIKLSEDYHNIVCTDRSCIIYERDKKDQK
jgi:hypothetical protein